MQKENFFAPVMESEISYEEIMANEAGYTKWNYEAPETVLSATGYEDYLAELEKYTSGMFHAETDEGKERIIQEVSDLYEKIGIYPIRYFSENGVISEIRKCMNFEANFRKSDDMGKEIVSTGMGIGTTLCSWFMPNLFKTPSAQDMTPDKEGGESAWDKFYNRKFLEKVVSFCFVYNTPGEGGYPGKNLMSGIRMIGSVPTNFRPMNAKAIFERFTPDRVGTPEDPIVVYDYCTGFGGRMLGALSSDKNLTYIGTDPNTETMYNLHRLGAAIESETGRTNSYELHCVGSEEFIGPANSVDFAFSSPPYFSLEQYGIDGGDFNNDEQCWQKYPELDEWMEGYVRKTIQNIGHMLKRRGKYAVNIADFNLGSEQVNYVDAWKRISEEEGMPLIDTVYLGVRARSGSKLLGNNDLGIGGSEKTENIMVFAKAPKRRML